MIDELNNKQVEAVSEEDLEQVSGGAYFNNKYNQSTDGTYADGLADRYTGGTYADGLADQYTGISYYKPSDEYITRSH